MVDRWADPCGSVTVLVGVVERPPAQSTLKTSRMVGGRGPKRQKPESVAGRVRHDAQGFAVRGACVEWLRRGEAGGRDVHDRVVDRAARVARRSEDEEIVQWVAVRHGDDQGRFGARCVSSDTGSDQRIRLAIVDLVPIGVEDEVACGIGVHGRAFERRGLGMPILEEDGRAAGEVDAKLLIRGPGPPDLLVGEAEVIAQTGWCLRMDRWQGPENPDDQGEEEANMSWCAHSGGFYRSMRGLRFTRSKIWIGALVLSMQPASSSMVRVTVYVPGAMKTWVGVGPPPSGVA